MKVQLMTKEIEQRLTRTPPCSTDGIPIEQKQVLVKFFDPSSQWTWYVFEGERQEDGDWLFFGAVEGLECELGYFSLKELANLRGRFGLPIERDRHYTQAEWKARDHRRFKR